MAKKKVDIDYTAMGRLDLYNKAKEDKARLKAAQQSGKPLPATPALDELHRRYEDMTSTRATSSKARSGKGNGNGAGAKVRADDKTVEAWVREAVLAGCAKHGSIVKFVRGKGHSASQERMGAAFDRIKGAADVKAALAKATTAPKAKPSNVTPITKKAAGKTTGGSKPTPPKPNGTTKKQTPGAKARAAAKKDVTPILKGQPVKKAAPKKAVGRKAAKTTARRKGRAA